MTVRSLFAVATVMACAAGSLLVSAVPAEAANVHSYSAGYSAQSLRGITSATWAFTLPTVSCPAIGHSLPLSLDGFVEGSSRGGPALAQSDMAVNCVDGKASWAGVVELSDSAGFVGKYVPATAGDAIRYTFTLSKGTAQIVAVDVTKARTLNVTRIVAGASFISASWAADPFGFLPKFTPVTWKGVTLNGSPISRDTPRAVDAYNGSHLLAKTSPLTAAGSGFKVTYVASS